MQLPHIHETVWTTWGVMLFLFLLCWLSSRRLQTNPGPWQTALEGVVSTIRDAIAEVIPEHADRILPFVGSLWIFLGIANLI
ncbi:MAG TPA: F0F1 ATP synthase subunit A, partial [Bryobacteraceae bacterium]|nr:F0F1 ATP synthase subunit A [Bryobacteraceae bacterium]